MKFAAIGVNNVPQNPAVKARALAINGLAPNAKTNGTPIPAVITEKAAKAFPITAVNNAIPTQYAVTPNQMFPVGTT